MTVRTPRSPSALASADFHIVPIMDLREHQPTRDCWCRPDCQREGRTVIVIHHSEDGRELVEQHGLN